MKFICCAYSKLNGESISDLQMFDEVDLHRPPALEAEVTLGAPDLNIFLEDSALAHEHLDVGIIDAVAVEEVGKCEFLVASSHPQLGRGQRGVGVVANHVDVATAEGRCS